MRLHTSSFAPSKLNLTQPLRGYEDSIARHKVDVKDLQTVLGIMHSINIENTHESIRSGLQLKDLSQVQLILALLLGGQNALTLGLIKAYSLQLNVALSEQGFLEILNILISAEFLEVKFINGVEKYFFNPSKQEQLIRLEM